MRILLVEDEQEYREFISPMLFEEGYDVQTAVNGADGLRLFQSQNQKKEPFDLIVSDSIMPMMTGIELTARIRMENPDIPIFILSGYDETRKQAEKAGCTKFIRKPIKRTELLDLIQLYLENLKSA